MNKLKPTMETKSGMRYATNSCILTVLCNQKLTFLQTTTGLYEDILPVTEPASTGIMLMSENVSYSVNVNPLMIHPPDFSE